MGGSALPVVIMILDIIISALLWPLKRDDRHTPPTLQPGLRNRSGGRGYRHRRGVFIDIECLRGSEEEDGEEVGVGDEGDNKRQGQDPRVLLELGWEDGIFRAIYLLDAKDNEQHGSEKEWDEDMG